MIGLAIGPRDIGLTMLLEHGNAPVKES